MLNADNVPSPKTPAQRPRRGWATSGVREILFRDLYRGRIVWGKTRWIDRRGTKARQDVPESEWVTLDAPALRIVAEELWNLAHERLTRRRETYLRLNNGRVWGKPEAGIESSRLLAGFVQCGECADAMHAIKRTSTRGAPVVYFVCNNHRVRGNTVCKNSVSVPMETLDAEVIAALRRDVLSADVIEDVIRRTLELRATTPGVVAERRERAQAELQRIEAELARYAEAIALGGPLPTILDAVKARENRRRDLKAQLEHLDGLQHANVPRSPAEIMRKISRRLTEWSGLLGRQPAQARQLLKKLLTRRLVLNPKITPDGRYYEVVGQASYGRLLTDLVPVAGMVAPG